MYDVVSAAQPLISDEVYLVIIILVVLNIISFFIPFIINYHLSKTLEEVKQIKSILLHEKDSN